MKILSLVRRKTDSAAASVDGHSTDASYRTLLDQPEVRFDRPTRYSALLVEQTGLLYQTREVISISLIIAGLSAATVRRLFPMWAVVAWFVAYCVVVLWQLLLIHLRKQAADAATTAEKWRRQFVAAACAAGLLWGIFGCFVLKSPGGTYDVFAVFVLGGVTAGSVVGTMAYLPACYAYVLPSALPAILILLTRCEWSRIEMGAMLGLFVLVLVVTGHNLNRAVLSEIRLRIEQGGLLMKLRRTEALMEEAQQIAHVGHWEFSQGSNSFNASEEAYAIYGLDPTTYEATLEKVIARAHPDDRARVSSRFAQVMADRTFLDIDHRIVLDDSSTRFVHVSGKVFYDEIQKLVHVVGTVQDVTDRETAEVKLRSAMALTEMILESMPAVVCIVDSADRYRRWNKNFLGYSATDMLGTRHTAIAPESVPIIQQAFKGIFEGQSVAETEAVMIAKDGARIPCYLTGTRITYEDEICVLGIAIDISRQKKAEEFIHLQSVALESAADAIVITDSAGTIKWVNPAFTFLTGYPLAEAVGRNPRILNSGAQDNSFYRTLWNTVLAGRLWAGDLTNLRKDGKLYNEEMHIAPVRSLSGEITNFIAIKRDVTKRNEAAAEIVRAKEIAERANRELIAANETIKQLARVDKLTALANRRALDEALKTETDRAQRLDKCLSIIMGDLDHFKLINDEYGHLAGDDVLTAAAAVFIGQSRSYDIAARFGGEEFMLLLPETPIEGAVAIADRIREKVESLRIPRCPRPITISLGVANWQQGQQPAELIAEVDAALYAAKQSGRNCVRTSVKILNP
jgi:diguanylate cyclase (GGDEF)-like protein/PAS domain S-box-containing protein